MTLRLPGGIAEAIRRHGEAAYPAECCGAMIGRVEGDAKEVLRLAPAVNRRTDDPHRYLIAPDDLRRLEREVRAAGQEIVGYYHSHPDHPARPSAFDSACPSPKRTGTVTWSGNRVVPAVRIRFMLRSAVARPLLAPHLRPQHCRLRSSREARRWPLWYV